MSDQSAQHGESVGLPHSSGRRARAYERLQKMEGGGVTAIVAYFKERVYATFTGLAIVLVVASNDAEADHAFFALVLGVLGITAAGFVSDVISHLAIHRAFPDGAHFAILARIAGGALGTVVAPAVFVLLAWLDVIPLDVALQVAAIVYIATLAAIGWFAVRRSRLAWWMQLLALAILVALGLLVIALQTLAHAV